jgi:hypothetical protein
LDFRNNSIYSSLDSDETSDGEIVCGRRQRRAIDYKKLYDVSILNACNIKLYH